jgi:hypothetical protein
MATNLPAAQASSAEDYWPYSCRDWIDHYYKPAKHELGWADVQVFAERAIVRRWQLVMLGFTFSLLAGAPPASAEPAELATDRAAGGRPALRIVWRATLREGPPLALPLGAPRGVLATLVDGSPAARVGCAA